MQLKNFTIASICSVYCTGCFYDTNFLNNTTSSPFCHKFVLQIDMLTKSDLPANVQLNWCCKTKSLKFSDFVSLKDHKLVEQNFNPTWIHIIFSDIKTRRIFFARPNRFKWHTKYKLYSLKCPFVDQHTKHIHRNCKYFSQQTKQIPRKQYKFLIDLHSTWDTAKKLKFWKLVHAL